MPSLASKVKSWVRAKKRPKDTGPALTKPHVLRAASAVSPCSHNDASLLIFTRHGAPLPDEGTRLEGLQEQDIETPPESPAECAGAHQAAQVLSQGQSAPLGSSESGRPGICNQRRGENELLARGPKAGTDEQEESTVKQLERRHESGQCQMSQEGGRGEQSQLPPIHQQAADQGTSSQEPSSSGGEKLPNKEDVDQGPKAKGKAVETPPVCPDEQKVRVLQSKSIESGATAPSSRDESPVGTGEIPGSCSSKGTGQSNRESAQPSKSPSEESVLHDGSEGFEGEGPPGLPLLGINLLTNEAEEQPQAFFTAHMNLSSSQPRISLPPSVQRLFNQQDALKSQLLSQDMDVFKQPLVERLDAIGRFLLESGPAMGDEELGSLQSEVQAMELFLKFEEEERAAARGVDSDRRLSACLQAAYDEELAAHLAGQLERCEGGPSAEGQEGMVQCSICLEELPKRDCIAACIALEGERVSRGETQEAEAQGSSASVASLPERCSHWHCVNCLRQYAAVKVMDDRTSRIPCTQAGTEGCPGVFPFENVEWLLGEKEADVFLALLAEESIAIKVYCPFDGCPAVMECAEGERGPDSICALCKRVFCRACRVAWHKNLTCEQYQTAKEDGPVLALAKKRNWKPCPKCHHMIERRNGCNHMQCKCGCGFCYLCGTAYLSTTRTNGKGNVHGTPGCKCGLF